MQKYLTLSEYLPDLSSFYHVLVPDSSDLQSAHIGLVVRLEVLNVLVECGFITLVRSLQRATRHISVVGRRLTIVNTPLPLVALDSET